MGLLDILNGLQNSQGSQQRPASGGMSPITMALMGLLAYKAFKSFGGSQPGRPANDGIQPSSFPGSGGGGLGDLLGGLLGGRQASSGGLSDLIPGGLGSLLGGASAGSVLSGGLGSLIKDLQNSGQGRAAQSWVGTGPNEEIAPNSLEAALGADAIDALTKQTGMGRDDLLAGLTQHLPGFVDQLTPHGRLPTEDEAAGMV